MTDSLGLESGAVRVVDYDPRWPDLFAAEAGRLGPVCNELRLRLEHVGSTAIPGMCGKPVLDIATGRPPEVSVPACIASLEAAGYEHRGEQGVPGREFFRRGRPRSYHIHLVRQGGLLWRRYIGFRDHLRAHREEADQYAKLKRVLAVQFPRDREAYIAAKSPLRGADRESARRCSLTGGWS